MFEKKKNETVKKWRKNDPKIRSTFEEIRHFLLIDVQKGGGRLWTKNVLDQESIH